MKRIWHHPQPPATGKRYWRSLGELEDRPEFRGWLEREFPAGASEFGGDEVSRRNFIRLMGASTALAGLGAASCRRPEAYIVPFAHNVEWTTPGKPVLYATAMPRLDGCTPLVVTSYEGRPTKVDGNPLHPGQRFAEDGEEKSTSGTDHFTQASVLDIYDPDRSRSFLNEGIPSDPSSFDGYLEKWLAEAGSGNGVGFLVGETSSPTRARIIRDLKIRYPEAKFYRYEVINRDEARAGWAAALGSERIAVVPRLERAKRILSLDCDFLGMDRVGGNPVRGFVSGRRAEKLAGVHDGEDGHKTYEWKPRGEDEMNRLYAVEAAYSVTGGMADHRLRMPLSQVLRAALILARELGVEGVEEVEPAGLNVERVEWLKTAAADLRRFPGEALVLAGTRQPAEVHHLAAVINEKLGAFGETLQLLEAPENESIPFLGVADLWRDLRTGEDGQKGIRTLISTTPADLLYDAPDNYRFREALEGVEFVHLGMNRNLSALAATWHIPAAHYLEAWGDLRSSDGTYSVTQPLILPLYGGLSELDLLLRFLGPEEAAVASDEGSWATNAAAVSTEAPSPALVAVRKTFEELGGEFSEGAGTAWNYALRDGFLPRSGYVPLEAPAVAPVRIRGPLPEPPAGVDSLEIAFQWDSKVYDGRFVNNGWLQETPDMVTSLTWGNAAVMSVATFKALGLKRDGQRIRVVVNGRSAYFPAQAIPGVADNCLMVAVGYGQTACGEVGYGAGFDAYPLRTSETTYFARGATAEVIEEDLILEADDPEANRAPDRDGKVRVARWEELALTQEHNSMEGRALARDGGLDEFHEDPEFSRYRGMDSHIPENISLYKPETKDGTPFNELDRNHQWAMTIDLSACIGCRACMMACQAENNIPIVGREQVLIGREMAWIRMDRYFADSGIAELEEEAEHTAPEDHAKRKELKKTVKSAQKAAKGTSNPQRGVGLLNEDHLEMITQPLACQHCESASCETVCPVNATVHSDDGLNAMAYNRCIGTRYCANNCPYKARRFNYFDYNKRNPLSRTKVGPFEVGNLYAGPFGEKLRSDVLGLQKNPNVTVRMRGVMEKCTYCVQRVETAKIAAKVAARGSADVKVGVDAVRTACQQACPAEAIVFGNLRQPADTVNAMKASPRNYEVLKYVGNRPRTTYLARIKNPNREMPGGRHVGQMTKHMH
ncbi:MAG TPA: TAT-variant-translocated molybdopterin oxidoreductase [Verrucomicrobiales bacterium]|nr:TAT-variant-translocated molybdopterin oxidoreductase [Verrucomicrobiales bacterium]